MTDEGSRIKINVGIFYYIVAALAILCMLKYLAS